MPEKATLDAVAALLLQKAQLDDVNQLSDHGALEKEFIRLGHPGGVIEVGVELKGQGDDYIYSKAILGRTARRLMEGYVLVPEKYFRSR